MGRRTKREEKKRKRRRKKEEEKKKKIQVWNISFCMDYLYGTTINLSLSKLCKKNHIRSVVG